MNKSVPFEVVDVPRAEIDLILAATLERPLRPEEERRLRTIVDAYEIVSAGLRAGRRTLRRLQRFLGMTSSEKTAKVLGGEKTDATGATSADVASGGQGAGSNQASDQAPAGGPTSAESSVKKPSAPASTDGDCTANQPAEPKRKGHGRVAATQYTEATHIAVGHDDLHAGQVCPKCNCGKLYPLHEPQRILRIIGQAPLVAVCWDCERIRCTTCGHVFTARAPEEAQGPKHTETAVAMMALLRYGTGIPLNRLEQLEGNLGTPLPASTQWETVEQGADEAKPAYEELCRLAAQGEVLHSDDSYARILQFMGKRRAKLLAQGKLEDPDRTGLFTTAIVALVKSLPIALFFTGRKHAGENLDRLLDQRAGDAPPPILMSDALSRNVPKRHAVDWVNCMAHARRGVVDEVDNWPAECRHILEQLSKVFATDEHTRRDKLSADERLKLHQRESSPLMDDLHKWMQALLDDKRVEPNSGMGEAIHYMLKRWDRLTRFLRVAGAPLENNITERALKKAIRHRKSSLFYKTTRGAEVGDIFMTLIHTAELHGENPFDYLTALLRNPKAVAENPADWLPWTYRATLECMRARASPAERACTPANTTAAARPSPSSPN